MNAERAATDAAKTALKATEAVLKKAWSLMEAATQKERPSEALSPKAIQAIQGQSASGGS
jgi:U3 small nucleolar ribonucleoprotein component